MTATRSSKLKSEYVCARGEELFEENIKSQVEHLDPEWHVVIDVESGEFAVGPEHIETSDRLSAKNPNAELYHRHVGHSWSACFGGRPLKPGQVLMRRIS